ncbi:RNA 9 protein [Orgyia pseudotsugata cypovirus 5]|uniref:RNA 9 protein n=1 Tax=Orgyia pseudotsugata cypovirus TaxID=31592 RepID=W6EKC9_CPVOP|nr:RNA 9 protein [Orgyia pseudotsugata cypovirus 5]
MLSACMIEIRRPNLPENNERIPGQFDTIKGLQVPAVAKLVAKVNERQGEFSKVGISREQRKLIWCDSGLMLCAINRGDILYRENDENERKKQEYGKMMSEAVSGEEDAPASRLGMACLLRIKWEEGANEILDELDDSLEEVCESIRLAKNDISELEKYIKFEKRYETTRFCNDVRFILSGKMLRGNGVKLPLLRYLYEDCSLKQILMEGNVNQILSESYVSIKKQSGKITKLVPTKITCKKTDKDLIVKLISKVRFYGTDISYPFIKKGFATVPVAYERETDWDVKPVLGSQTVLNYDEAY